MADEPRRSVVRRLLSVLATFDAATPTLSLTEIAARTELPLPTAHRFLAELTTGGWLERLPDGRYRVGLRLWKLGTLAPSHRNLRELALPYMQDLHDATRETIQLAVLDGRTALCVENINGSRSAPAKTRIGGRLPLHATGVGKVLLAAAGPELLASLAEKGFRRFTRYTIVEPGRLTRTLETVRDEQVAFSREEMTLGACSVASPVTSESGEVVAALSIVAHSSVDVDRLAFALRTAASGISRQTRLL
ncbi:IclR family transcriptional regulator [Kutzneria kofuensis]|uniref:Glycerol operon regulatory protein n=1 Tax=Kutzneria kofuensis TaxID=103725 RepID=A0A7W9NFC2_9PSEU|nr:IclR family transcriptional regulator [Kutzneria kofuensis]MBB5891232.1 DNA-binding IclR family transcriptional regulator [Kutzneria kofuensis]